MLRKIHLANAWMKNDWDSIQKDLDKRPVEGVSGDAPRLQIKEVLQKYGISEGRVELWGTGKPMREFLWSEDMADACVFIIENVNFADLAQDKTEIRNCHINIGTGKEISIRNLSAVIQEAIGYKGAISFDESKPDGTPRKLTDVTKLNGLGWKHSIDIEEGVRRMYNWYTGAP